MARKEKIRPGVCVRVCRGFTEQEEEEEGAHAMQWIHTCVRVKRNTNTRTNEKKKRTSYKSARADSLAQKKTTEKMTKRKQITYTQ